MDSRNNMRALLVAAAMGLSGCGTSIEPTQADLKDRWETANVPPAAYRGDIVAFMRTYLNDPTNVRNAQIAPPTLKRVIGDPGDRFVACVRFNARDTAGKYPGPKTGAATFYNGKLDRFLDQPREVRSLCGEGIAFEPFPELERIHR
ncbi:MAG: hypothetical protein JOZ70_11230 [Pseudolabrys sp.]|nr:hypothetical protein [Pseudolabrys sp.]MBV9955813.1 hypothetical protein [Pseudolabrys sp.]